MVQWWEMLKLRKYLVEFVDLGNRQNSLLLIFSQQVSLAIIDRIDDPDSDLKLSNHCPT